MSLFALLLSAVLTTTGVFAAGNLKEDATNGPSELRSNTAESGFVSIEANGKDSGKVPPTRSGSKHRKSEGDFSLDKTHRHDRGYGPFTVKPELLPDLTVQSITRQNNSLTIALTNVGHSDIDPTQFAVTGSSGRTAIYIDDMNTARFHYSWATLSNTDFLAVGGLTEIAPMVLTAEAHVKACVDSTNLVHESNEGNNCTTIKFPRSLPDLVVQDVFFADHNDDRGFRQLSYVLANIGGYDVDSVNVGIRYGPSANGPHSAYPHLSFAMGKTDIYFEQTTNPLDNNWLSCCSLDWHATHSYIDFLAVGGSTTFTGSHHTGAEPSGPGGSFVAMVCVDSMDVVPESNEQNNCKTVFLNPHAFRVRLSANTNSISESGGISTLTATLYAPGTVTPFAQPGSDVTVNLSYSGSAIAGTDYSKSDAITIRAGDTSGSILIAGIADLISEGTETIIADISTVIGAREQSVSQATISVLDDDIVG